MKAALALFPDRAELTFSYDPSLTAALKMLGGFRWSPDRRCWWTKDVEKGKAAAEAINQGTMKDMIDAMNARREEAVAVSKAADSDIDIPCPKGLAYLPFQKAGIAYALQRKNVLFGDEPGLGKTIQAIGLGNAVDAKSILVICPASLKINWRNELKKWLVRKHSVGIAKGNFWPQTSVVVINYEILHKRRFRIHESEWDLVVVDEAHYLKDPEARRTKEVFGYIPPPKKRDKATVLSPIPWKRLACLTGTPIPSKPIEGWTIFHALGPDKFPSFMAYATKFCDARQGCRGWEFGGASNLGELQLRLRESFMVRRLKQDVLAELPPKRRQIFEFEAEDSDRLINELAWKSYNGSQEEEAQAAYEAAKAATKGDKASYKAAVERLKEAAKIRFEKMSEVRHESAVHKIDRVIDYLETALESGPVVCMAHHRDVVEAIAAHFGPKAVKLYGGMAAEEKNEAVEAFQHGRADLFVGSIMAAGVGLTLTRSSTVVFAEFDWVPGNMTQAEDRCHRIGQKDSVNVVHLVVEGSLDAHMARTLVRKQEVLDAALDDPIVFEQWEEDHGSEATVVPPKAADSAAAKLTGEDIETVHECLRTLCALNPDGATEINGVGFNKIDQRIGWELAKARQLTAKQAALGLRICAKYNKTQLRGVLDETLERIR